MVMESLGGGWGVGGEGGGRNMVNCRQCISDQSWGPKKSPKRILLPHFSVFIVGSDHY